MKRITILFSIIALSIWSCVPEDDAFFATSTNKAASVTVPANVPYVKDVSSGVSLPIGLLGKSKATDIQSVKMLCTFVPAGETANLEEDGTSIGDVTTYPTTVEITDEELLTLAGLTS